MKDIRNIHNQAMELMRQANQHLQDGDRESYLANTRAALELEQEAAIALFANLDSEPTRSVLFRSAANLAYNIGEYDKAEKLIYQALAGSPHSEIKAELLQLKDRIETAFVRQLSASDIIEYNYVNVIREHAINLKVEPKSDKYSKAVLVDYIIDFLRNAQASYKNLAEVLFRKNFTDLDYPNFEQALALFRKDSNLLTVALEFQSFGIGLVADTVIMAYKHDFSEKFAAFRRTIFERFKTDILFADLNSNEFQQQIADEYNEVERAKIYSNILTSLDSKAEYTVSIADQDFKYKVKELPPVNKKAQAFFKPKVSRPDDGEGELLIKKTMELTDAEGHKKTRLQTEFMSYAEFQLDISTIRHKEVETQIFFTDPYTIKIIFKDNSFSIDDPFFDIYLENKDYKEIQRVYELELIRKYLEYAAKTEPTIEEEAILQNMKNTFLVS